jgi:hypothetical protein
MSESCECKGEYLYPNTTEELAALSAAKVDERVLQLQDALSSVIHALHQHHPSGPLEECDIAYCQLVMRVLEDDNGGGAPRSGG